MLGIYLWTACPDGLLVRFHQHALLTHFREHVLISCGTSLFLAVLQPNMGLHKASRGRSHAPSSPSRVLLPCWGNPVAGEESDIPEPNEGPKILRSKVDWQHRERAHASTVATK